MKTQDAIEFFGSRKAIADALGIWPQSVYNWGENVPELRAYQLREKMEARRMEDELWDELNKKVLEDQASERMLDDIDETEFEHRCDANEEENRMMDF